MQYRDTQHKYHFEKIGYGTFEGYCLGRWKISRARVYQLIEAYETGKSLSNILDISNIQPA